MASLHATDKIQRDIEDIFERSDYFYERRKNFHNNLGNPLAKVVTPLYIASGYVSLVLKSPQKASNLRSRFMRSDEAYNTVFSEKIPLSVYPVIAAVLKITDLVLEDFRPKRGSGGERFLKRWRQVVSFITVSRLLGSFDFSVVDLSKLDIEKYTYEEVKETWNFICLRRPEDIISKNIKNKHYYVALCQEAADEFSISDISRVEKANNFNTNLPAIADSHKYDNVIIDLELVQKIDELLPPQPWKPGVHKTITKALGCSNKEYFQAVQILIEDGIRNKQVDGVVYDIEGNVITFDPERVDPDTLELLDT